MVSDIIHRYSRHLLLKDFGKREQESLLNSKVLIIGCGGLGSPVVQYLAAAGVGHLTLCDGDGVDLSNLNRQIIFTENDISENKARVASEFVKELNSSIKVEVINNHLDFFSIRHVIRNHDLVMDCTDGLPIKFLINDSCVLENKMLIHGAASSYEGRVFSINGQSGPCLRCIFEDLPPAGIIPSCSSIGIFGPVCGVIGSVMSMEAIFYLCGFKRQHNYYCWDFATSYNASLFLVTHNESCKACGNDPVIHNFNESDYSLLMCEN